MPKQGFILKFQNGTENGIVTKQRIYFQLEQKTRLNQSKRQELMIPERRKRGIAFKSKQKARLNQSKHQKSMRLERR